MWMTIFSFGPIILAVLFLLVFGSAMISHERDEARKSQQQKNKRKLKKQQKHQHHFRKHKTA